MNDLISPEKFEQARLAFVAAWLECDEKQKENRIDGARTTCGLLAALDTLGIHLVEG
jgi:hypothetical protein